MKSYIPVRMASTGSNLDAESAGKTPDINPINVDKENPINIFQKDKTNSKSSTAKEATIEIIHTNSSPINPPITARIIASNKN